MFDFFNGQKNPFMQNPFMMNPFMQMTGTDANEGADSDNAAGDPMQFMQQMFMMQMQMAQNMMMLPMQFMQNMMNMAAGMTDMPGMTDMFKGFGMFQNNGEGSDAQKDGFSLGGMNISPEMLKKLMQMDMTPENLEKLQKVLDFVFETMPEPENK